MKSMLLKEVASVLSGFSEQWELRRRVLFERMCYQRMVSSGNASKEFREQWERRSHPLQTLEVVPLRNHFKEQIHQNYGFIERPCQLLKGRHIIDLIHKHIHRSFNASCNPIPAE